MNRRCNYKHSHHLQQRTMFLPIMICSRSSLKDVKLSHCHRRSSDEPPSPKFRPSAAQSKRNSKVSGIPTYNHHHSLNSTSSSAAAITANHAAPTRNINNIKYHNLRRLFSVKSLTEKSTATNSDSTAAARSEILIEDGHLRNYTFEARSKCGDGDRRKSRVDLDLKPAKPINVAELDPPLPVLRRPAPRQLESDSGEEERESLWKRRSRGSALGSLQVQSIHVCATGLLTMPANTV